MCETEGALPAAHKHAISRAGWASEPTCASLAHSTAMPHAPPLLCSAEHSNRRHTRQQADTSNGLSWTVCLNNTPTVDPVFPVLLKRNHPYHQKAGALHAAHTLIPREEWRGGSVPSLLHTNPSQPRGRP